MLKTLLPTSDIDPRAAAVRTPPLIYKDTNDAVAQW